MKERYRYTTEKWKNALFPEMSHNPIEKYRYLGYAYIPYDVGTREYVAVLRVIELIDSKARRWWIPRFILRLLHAFGSDNSIVRVNNRFLHNLHRKLTRGFFITDIKTKWNDGDIRIYGYFDTEIDNLIEVTEDLIQSYYENK